MWDARDNSLLFVDILGRQLHRLTLDDGSHESWRFDEPICWVIPRRNSGGYVAGFKSGFKIVDLAPLKVTSIGTPEPDIHANRMNDAKADSSGRIWAGTMNEDNSCPSGALYRLDCDFSWRQMDDDYYVANGPTFSPDGNILYHADSERRLIYAFDMTSDGSLSNKRVFVRFRDDWGYPDGMTTDAEGGVWIAHWDGARVSRFTPDGFLDRSIPMPVKRPTSCTFGGENCDRLFVTSAAMGDDDNTSAGAVFEIDASTRGIPADAFGG